MPSDQGFLLFILFHRAGVWCLIVDGFRQFVTNL